MTITIPEITISGGFEYLFIILLIIMLVDFATNVYLIIQETIISFYDMKEAKERCKKVKK